MSSRKRNALIMLIVAIVLGIAVIVSGIILIMQRVGGIDKIVISASFSDMELDVNSEYTVAIMTEPSGANAEKFEFISDSSAAVFEYKEDNTAVIRTLGTGEVSFKVKYKGKESNTLTYRVVDKAAEAQKAADEAAAQAEAEAIAAAEAAAQAEAEAAAQPVVYVKVIKDSVNVRQGPSTDGDPVGKANKGDTFEVVAVEGEWTQVKFSGETLGYIRNDMIETVSDSADSSEASAEQAQPAEEKKEAAKKAEEEAKKQQEAAAKAAEEELKKQQEALAAAAAAAPPAAAGSLPAAGPWVYGGVTFSAAEVAYFHSLWDYTGDAAEMVTHHSAEELVTLCQNNGLR